MRVDGGVLMSINPFLIAATAIGVSAAGATATAIKQFTEARIQRTQQSRRYRISIRGQSDRKPSADVKARISIGDTNIEFTGDNVDDLMDVLSSWIESNRSLRSHAADEAETGNSP